MDSSAQSNSRTHPPTEPVTNASAPPALVTEGLSKTYGNHPALVDLNLSVRAGEVFGYIGPNGAGKTTTFRILAGLLDPTSGVARIAGSDVTGDRDRIKQLVGYLPDNFGIYPQLRVEEYLDFFAAAYRIPRKQRKERIDHCLDIANAAEYRDKLMGALSRGMKQRVGIAKTLLHDPAVLILDEPAATLDPRARIQMRQLLRQLAAAGKAVLVSSHILPELADVCDTIAILVGGKMLVCGPVQEVLRRVQPHRVVEIKISGSSTAARQLLERAPGRWRIVATEPCAAYPGVTLLKCEMEGDDSHLAQTLQMLVREGMNVVHFAELPANIEEAFMRLTE